MLVTVGGSEGIDMAIRTLVCPGDEVLVVEPSFVCYKPLVEVSGGVAVPLVTKEEDNFRLTAAALEAAITPKAKLLVFPYPNNPTGAVMRREDLEPICRVLQKHKIYVLSDEIYSELTYGGVDHTSIAAMPGMAERTVVINGFSKTYSMTGWRLGYALGPAPIIQQMTKLHQFAIMSAPTTSQTAAIEALRHGDGTLIKCAGIMICAAALPCTHFVRSGCPVLSRRERFICSLAFNPPALVPRNFASGSFIPSGWLWCPATPLATAARALSACLTAILLRTLKRLSPVSVNL